MSVDVIAGDRRVHRRYQAELRLSFRYTDRTGVNHPGTGVTIELSRGGIRFHSDDHPPVGTKSEFRIAWPFLLQDICPLELIVKGTVLGTSDRGTVVRTCSYEFRTCGDRSFSDASGGPSTSMVA